MSVTFSVSLTMGTLKSEGPQQSFVEPSSKLHSLKHVTTYTAGWPVCRVQQVSVCVRRGWYIYYWYDFYLFLFLVLVLKALVTFFPALMVSRQPSVPSRLDAFAAENSER